MEIHGNTQLTLHLHKVSANFIPHDLLSASYAVNLAHLLSEVGLEWLMCWCICDSYRVALVHLPHRLIAALSGGQCAFNTARITLTW